MVRHLTSPMSADAHARQMGFHDAATMTAYYQRQREMDELPGPKVSSGSAGQPAASSGSLLDRIFSWHPAVLLQHVVDAFSKAGQ